jgi:hypothetical protein
LVRAKMRGGRVERMRRAVAVAVVLVQVMRVAVAM